MANTTPDTTMRSGHPRPTRNLEVSNAAQAALYLWEALVDEEVTEDQLHKAHAAQSAVSGMFDGHSDVDSIRYILAAGICFTGCCDGETGWWADEQFDGCIQHLVDGWHDDVKRDGNFDALFTEMLAYVQLRRKLGTSESRGVSELGKMLHRFLGDWAYGGHL